MHLLFVVVVGRPSLICECGLVVTVCVWECLLASVCGLVVAMCVRLCYGVVFVVLVFLIHLFP